MYILAIESSCDESAAAVIQFNNKEEFDIKSSIVSSQIELHQEYGGVVPELAAREHVINILPVIDQALSKAKISHKDLNALAITAGPGLITSLLTASETAKSLAYAWDLAILEINHIEGHIYSSLINQKKDLQFPALILTVSGGHNLLVLMKDHLKYKVIGETLDDAAGEAFDKAAKMMGLSYPGGPIISQRAEQYINNHKDKIEEIKLPRPMIHAKNYNFSFSGLKTALLYTIKKDKHWKKKIDQYAYSFQKAVIDVLVHKSLKAAQEYKVKSIIVTGGVSANKELRKRFDNEIKTKFTDINLFYPELKYTGDNAAMIAVAAAFNYLKNKKKIKSYKNIKVSSNLEFK